MMKKIRKKMNAGSTSSHTRLPANSRRTPLLQLPDSTLSIASDKAFHLPIFVATGRQHLNYQVLFRRCHMAWAG